MPRHRKSVVKKTSRKSSAGGAALSSRLTKLEKKIGQKNLAKLLGVTPRSIRRYKQGIRKPQPPVMLRVKRAGRYSKGLRKTKSIKLRTARTDKIIRAHPESVYFEKRMSFEFAETEHIDILDIHISDIPGLLEYLSQVGCDMAYFIIRGVDKASKEARHYSSEVMYLPDFDFEEGWRDVLAGLMAQYIMAIHSIDLIGIKHHAPTPQEG